MTPSPYAVYNAALMNGWTVSETAREFGIELREAANLILTAGGRIYHGKVS